MINNNFITVRDDLGVWDVNRIINDLKNLLTSNGYDWEEWKGLGKIVKNGVLSPTLGLDLNLTSNVDLCPTIDDRLWKYSGRYYSEAKIEHRQLSYIIPEIEGTYLSAMIRKMQEAHGRIRVRLHNRTSRAGLYWHIDKNSDNRYHLALWTNPGHFLVWTDQFKSWDDGFDPEECKKPMKFNAEFIPADGKIRLLETHNIMHGVANIGVGYKQPDREQSRCHLTFWKV